MVDRFLHGPEFSAVPLSQRAKLKALITSIPSIRFGVPNTMPNKEWNIKYGGNRYEALQTMKGNYRLEGFSSLQLAVEWWSREKAKESGRQKAYDMTRNFIDHLMSHPPWRAGLAANYDAQLLAGFMVVEDLGRPWELEEKRKYALT